MQLTSDCRRLLLPLLLLQLTDNATEMRHNEKYAELAPPLAFAAARRAIDDWGGDTSDITHVLSCSCTGVLIPGPTHTSSYCYEMLPLYYTCGKQLTHTVLRS